jgi:hypothetical protein
MSEALACFVRSVDFRDEDAGELPQEFNIVLWDGQQRLKSGVLEYLSTRST